MDIYKHCNLCENEIKNLEKGIICGLTKRKPNFKNTCSDIKLDKKFNHKLQKALLELEKVGRNKRLAHLNFYISIVAGFSIIILSKYIAEVTHSGIFFWKVRIGTIGIGITILMIAYNRLNKFRDKLRRLEYEKNKIDFILDEYGITYETTFNFKEEVPGVEESIVSTKFTNWIDKSK